MRVFSDRTENKELAVVFDIGSASVGGAIFEVKKTGVPKIIFSAREPIAFEKKIEGEKFLLSTLKSLEKVAEKLLKKSAGSPSRIFCVLSSPWYASQVRTIKLEKNIPFPFTAKFADSLIEKEILLLKGENLDDKVRPIEFKSMRILLNNYETPEPFDKKAKKVEMNVFVSLAGEKILKRIEESIAKHFHKENIKFVSFAMASFAVVRDNFAREENFLLLDIAGEVTDISMVKKNALVNSVSYPLGRNFLLRKLSEELGSTLDEAKTLLSLYKDKHAADATEKKLEPILKTLKDEWLRGFQESLFSISDDISVPGSLFIAVDQDLAHFFGETIKKEELNQYALSERGFRVTFLDTETLHGTASFEEDTDRDPFIILESVYLNRFLC